MTEFELTAQVYSPASPVALLRWADLCLLDVPLVISCGVGNNSLSELIGLYERGIMPSVILFADTGGEHKRTYDYIPYFNRWLVHHGMPQITICRYQGKYKTLEEECLTLKTLPPIAYGFKTCSLKWKKEAQDQYLNKLELTAEHWASGGKIIHTIGFHYEEQGRASFVEDKRNFYWFPLIEWKWGRKECLAAFDRHGLKPPGKSSCTFCASMTLSEIIQLKRTEPERAAVSRQIEANCEGNRNVKGLGRRFSHTAVMDADDAQIKLFPEADEIPCMCSDGWDEPTD